MTIGIHCDTPLTLGNRVGIDFEASPLTCIDPDAHAAADADARCVHTCSFFLMAGLYVLGNFFGKVKFS